MGGPWAGIGCRWLWREICHWVPMPTPSGVDVLLWLLSAGCLLRAATKKSLQRPPTPIPFLVLVFCYGCLANLGSDGRTVGSRWVSLGMPIGVDVLPWQFGSLWQGWADHVRSLDAAGYAVWCWYVAVAV